MQSIVIAAQIFTTNRLVSIQAGFIHNSNNMRQFFGGIICFAGPSGDELSEQATVSHIVLPLHVDSFRTHARGMLVDG